MTDYKLDSEVQAFVEKTAEIYPGDVLNSSIQENRRHYDQLCHAFQAPIPASITRTDHEIPGRNGPIPIRIYENPQHRSPQTVIYLHGGGFILGNLDSHDSVCAEISDFTQHRVVAVGYRLAPEFVHPVQFEDALDVFLAIDQGHTVVAGDSAGATLAASICIAQRSSDHQPIGQILIYPWLGGQHFGLKSYVTCANAPGLSSKDIDRYTEVYAGGEAPWHDPIFAPLALDQCSDLPPCMAFAAEHDPIRDDTAAYVGRLQNAGVKAECIVESGLVHGYLRARHCSEKARASFERICNSIKNFAEV